MKKLLLYIMPIMLLLSCFLTGCSEIDAEETDKLSIVTTCFPPYDFARAVAGENADITMLLHPGAEAHSYEPAPLDILAIRQCDVFIYIGGEGEVWVDKILETFDTSDMEIICLSDFSEKLAEKEVPGASPNGHNHEHSDNIGEEDNHSEGEHNDEYDEHIWTSLRNAKSCMEGIRSALCHADPEAEQIYTENTENYIAQLDELDEKFKEMTGNAPSDLIIIGDRFPFRYLTENYNLEYFAAFSGCSSESEPGVYTMAFLIDEILEHKLDTVFYLEFSTKKLAEKLCDATGAKMLPLHSCHNVSKEDFENGVTYIQLMRNNLENLREALY